MLETSLRPGFSAHIFTSYMNTTDKCLALFYNFRGSDLDTTLKVKAITENKTVHVLSVLKANGLLLGWTRHYTRLPPGLHMLSIVGQRGTEGLSGLAVDDIMVESCERMEGGA